jgi:hypothetical protein
VIVVHIAIIAVCTVTGDLYKATAPMWTAMTEMYKATRDDDPAKQEIRAAVTAEAVFATADRAGSAGLYMVVAELYKDPRAGSGGPPGTRGSGLQPWVGVNRSGVLGRCPRLV